MIVLAALGAPAVVSGFDDVQPWVSRSSSAVVILASPKTDRRLKPDRPVALFARAWRSDRNAIWRLAEKLIQLETGRPFDYSQEGVDMVLQLLKPLWAEAKDLVNQH